MSRPRLIALAVAGLAVVVMATWVTTWARATPAQIASADYTPTYVAATSWRQGHGAGLYDLREHSAEGATLGLAGAQYMGNRYVYAPLGAVVAAPFSLLTLDASYRVWSLLQLGLLVLAVVIVARAAPWPQGLPRSVPWMACALGLAGAGTAMLVLLGQWDGFSALSLAVAYASWRKDRRALGGAALAVGSLLAKPHLLLVVAAWLLGRRDRRMLAGAAAGALGVVAASLVFVGPAAVAGFVAAPSLSSGVTPARMLLGFLGFFTSWLAPGPPAFVLTLLAGCAAAAGGAVLGSRTRRDPRTLELSLAAATVLSLLASPHVLVQDLSLLAPPLVWCLARAAATDGAAHWPGWRTLALILGWVALDIAARADVGNYAAGPPGRLVPVVLLAAVGITLAAAIVRRRYPQPSVASPVRP